MTGTSILHYQIGKCLGVGGMGEVYLARDTRLGRSVALKFLKPSVRADAALRGRLLREARAASALHSSNIAAIYDIVEQDDVTFIVMEYVEGEPLSAIVARGPQPVREALRIARQAAEALDDAHTHGVIHRDIKSANLLVDERGRVKLLDFGLAKQLPTAVSDGNAQTRTALMETVAGTVMGTFAYMSPEQVRGRPVDVRTDLFSLGIVIYEMVTGRLPFDGATVTEVIDGILNREPAAVARFNYNVPATLEAIIRKSLAKDPAFRYQSARDMYIDLTSVLRALEHESEMRSSASSDSTRTSIETVASATLPQERAVAVMTFANITREPADDWIGSGIAETVTADLKNVRGLTIIGRAQVFEALKHLSTGDLQRVSEQVIDIGRRLGAKWIVGGAYQRLGPRIRITAEIVDVTTGRLLKTVKVDGEIADLFALQDKIVYELTQGLNVTLRPSEIEAIDKRETESLEAFETYSRGMMNLRLATPDSIDRAISLFEQAIGHDPNYATAWAMLGMAYGLKGQFLSIAGLTLKGLEALERANRIDPEQADAHTGLAMTYLNLKRHDEAIAEARRAVALDPKSAWAHAVLGRSHWLGRGEINEAIDALETAVSLNTESGYAFLQLSWLYAIRGDFEKAEHSARHAADLQERAISGTEGLQTVGAHVRLGYVYYRQGRYADAIAEFDKETAFLATHDHGLRERVALELQLKLAAVYWRLDDRARADEHFEQAIKSFRDRVGRGADDGFTKYYVAGAYALRGEEEPAVRYLKESIDALGNINRLRAQLDPDFDPVRGAPTFSALFWATAT